MTQDLTKGSPMGLMFRFGFPLLLGFLFQQLYNLVDTAIVGKTLGGDALAAVGTTGSINFLVVGFVSGVCGGFAIPVAQQFGARNPRELRRFVAGAVWLCAAFGLVITVATALLCGPILTAMHTPADIFRRAYLYIFTIFCGIPAYFLYNMCAGILRSLGDSRTPVIWLVAASLVNVVLDIVFILTFRMDVFGAAFATVLAQLMAGLGCLGRLCRGFPILRTRREDWRWDRRRMTRLCAMGLPMGLQYSITAIGSIVLQAAVNDLGTAYITAVTAGSKVSVFLCCPFDALGAAIATYGGQNVGARRWDRLHSGLRACSLLGVGYAVAAFGVVLAAGGWLNGLFLDGESMALLPMVQRFLVLQAAFYIPLAFVNIVRFLIQGMGFPPIATLSGVLEMTGRTAMALAVPAFGFSAACLASPAAWILADLFLFPAYFLCHRRLRSAPVLSGACSEERAERPGEGLRRTA